MKIPADENQSIFIAKSRWIAYAQNFQETVAIVIPDTNNLNDYGHSLSDKRGGRCHTVHHGSRTHRRSISLLDEYTENTHLKSKLKQGVIGFRC